MIRLKGRRLQRLDNAVAEPLPMIRKIRSFDEPFERPPRLAGVTAASASSSALNAAV